jgi:hypothetical protein
MRYHDVKVRVLIRLAAFAAFLAVLAVLSLIYPDEAASLARWWRRGFSYPVLIPITLGLIAVIISIVGLWMAFLTPAQEAQMFQKREAKGTKRAGTPHPSLFDQSDPDYHTSTFRYLLKKWRA